MISDYCIRKSVSSKKIAIPHSHDTWEIILNIEGNGHSNIGDKAYDFGPGTITCLPPGLCHDKVSTEGFTDIFLLVPHFPTNSNEDVIHLQDNQSKSFEILMNLTYTSFVNEDVSNFRNLLGAFHELINQLLISWINPINSDPTVEEMKNKLKNSFMDPEFSISELGSHVFYCSDHLRRRFKKTVGMTPTEYLIDLRLNHAKKLLTEHKGYTISEISTMCGYYDSRYFSRLFKKRLGVTPREFAEVIT